jgi:hypothetical protein
MMSKFKGLGSEGAELELQRLKPHRLRHLSFVRRGLSKLPIPLLEKERLGEVFAPSTLQDKPPS